MDIGQLVRQGDVVLERVAALPAAAVMVPRQGRIVVEHGETTGHAHAILEPGVTLYNVVDAAERVVGQYLEVAEPAVLIHEEHGPITLEPGIYRRWHQVEADGEEEPLIGRFLNNRLLGTLQEVGDVTEVRFDLKRVRLADGAYHEFAKPVQVRLRWDPEVAYFVAVDGRTGLAGEGDSALEALTTYLEDWCERIRMLEEEEATLGKGLRLELARLRRMVLLNPANAG